MPKYTVLRLQEALNEVKLPVNGTNISLLGLSYKEDIADLRESPCLEIMDILKNMGANLTVYDPYVKDMSTVETLDDALDKCSAVVISTAHKVFADLTQEIYKRDNILVVIDGMNKLDKEKIIKSGKIYRGIGR
jgi:UDP-N-acetyl-D-glucosamine dehydrogenase